MGQLIEWKSSPSLFSSSGSELEILRKRASPTATGVIEKFYILSHSQRQEQKNNKSANDALL